ncbi:MAG: hypothetical protein ACHQ9S_18820 [Candidatus Binatia bacterium]
MSSYPKIKPGLGLCTSGACEGHTQREQAPDSKQIKVEQLPAIMTPVDLGKHKEFSQHTAPVSRIYTNDYSKVAPEKDDRDAAGPALGPPLRW